MNKITFQRFSPENLPVHFFQHWIDLIKSNSAFHNPFFSPYFAVSASLAAPSTCYVTILFRDNAPIGFFPFQFINKVIGRAGRIGLHLSDYNGIICMEKISAAELKNLLKASGIHQYAFDHLHSFQFNIGIPAEYVREGCATDLTDGFQSYWEQLEISAPKITKDTLRSIKKITKEIGSLVFTQHIADRKDLDLLIEVKRAQYKSTGVEDALGNSWTRACLTNLQAIQNFEFCGMLSKLTAGEQVISMHFGILANGILHFWFPIYISAYSKYSPGRLLFYHLLKHADATGIKSIDQGMGLQRYKTNFTNRTYKLGVGTIRQNTPQCLAIRIQDYLHYVTSIREKSLTPDEYS